MKKKKRKNAITKKATFEEIKNSVKEALDVLPPEVQEYLIDIMRRSSTPEEAIRRVLVGDCPECDSENTRDCEDTPIDDSTVGLCLNCNIMWCLGCGAVFEEGQTLCRHWEICEICHHINDTKEDCTIEEFQGNPGDCPMIRAALEKWTIEGGSE